MEPSMVYRNHLDALSNVPLDAEDEDIDLQMPPHRPISSVRSRLSQSLSYTLQRATWFLLLSAMLRKKSNTSWTPLLVH